MHFKFKDSKFDRGLKDNIFDIKNLAQKLSSV